MAQRGIFYLQMGVCVYKYFYFNYLEVQKTFPKLERGDRPQFCHFV